MLAAAAVAVAFLAGSVLWAQLGQQEAEDQTGVVEQQRDATAAQAQNLAAQIQAACASGELTGVVCAQAERVAAEPVPPVPGPVGPIGPLGPQGPAPTPEQIRSAVDAYLAANPPPPGRAPTASDVAAAVTNYLTANPPAPGRAPTAGEIAAAVELYFDTNPPPAGPQGEPGRPPTAEEIRAAVDAYLAEHPPPAGPSGPVGDPGPPGAQGVGVEDVRLEAAGGCELVFVLVNPADGTTTDHRVPVDNAMCDGVAPDDVIPETGSGSG